MGLDCDIKMSNDIYFRVDIRSNILAVMLVIMCRHIVSNVGLELPDFASAQMAVSKNIAPFWWKLLVHLII